MGNGVGERYGFDRDHGFVNRSGYRRRRLVHRATSEFISVQARRFTHAVQGQGPFHFRFTDEGITDEVVEARRVSSYFVPIARPKKKGKQLEFDTEWTKDRIEENRLVNQIRQRVLLWREGGYVSVTPTTARLLQYWTNPERDKKLFFCQIEALETAVYITEAAKKCGDAWIENALREANDTSNPGLPRMALKMATGSGKTVVMAMLIAWHALNKFANAQDVASSRARAPTWRRSSRYRPKLPNHPADYQA